MKLIPTMLALLVGSVLLAGCGSGDDSAASPSGSSKASLSPGKIGGAGSTATPGKPAGTTPAAPQ